jgi:hypothetical protein
MTQMNGMAKLLVVGVYLADKPNLALSVTHSINQSKLWSVDFRWARIGFSAADAELQAVTKLTISQPMAKMAILNRLLSDIELADYEYVMVLDDDIVIPDGFVDRYLEIKASRGFALSQPARTHSSYIDHYFVAQLMGIESRQTNFVEIGPLFVVSRSAYSLILPLDERPPMGWGLDFVWPVLIERHGLSMGIIDASPVEHSFRQPVAYYDHTEADIGMKKFFAENEHLSYEETFRIFKSYPLPVVQSL